MVISRKKIVCLALRCGYKKITLMPFVTEFSVPLHFYHFCRMNNKNLDNATRKSICNDESATFQ